MIMSPPSPTPVHDGLFRTRIAGGGATTTSAFVRLRIDTLHEIPNDPFAPGAGLYGRRVMVSDDPAEGHWEMMGLNEDAYLVISECHYARPRSEISLPEDFVEFHFYLKGPAHVAIPEADDVHIDAPTLTIVQQGNVCCRVTCQAGTWRAVSLYVRRGRFERFLTASLGADHALHGRLHPAGSTHLSYLQLPVGADALHAIEKLIANPYTGHRRLMYAEAKVCEILCASLDLWDSFADAHTLEHVFSGRDLRMIEKARDMLLADISHMPTIPTLARAVGTNTSKLKRGFKFLYGQTVFQLGQSRRMEYALDLLIDSRMSVSEVATAVGYQHQTSFTASFRDHFGFAPREARRMRQAALVVCRPKGDSARP